MKKKTRRQLKKGMKSLRRAWKALGPGLGGGRLGTGLGGLTASSLLVAAALDPRVRDGAKELASALGDLAKRVAGGELANSELHDQAH